jgi:hypothetical protein
VTARLEKVEGVELTMVPFRMKWRDQDMRPFALDNKPSRQTQKRISVGGVEQVIVAQTNERKLMLPLPDGLAIPIPRPESGLVELDIVFITNPLTAEPFGCTYTLKLDGHAKILEFSEKKRMRLGWVEQKDGG